MKVLFWNTNRNNNINNYLLSLVKDNEVDILVLAEYCDDEKCLLELFRKNNIYLGLCNTYGCRRIEIWSNYINIKPGIQTDYFSLQIINDEFILCCTHLPSDLNGDNSDERLELVGQIMREISQKEVEIESNKVIIVGDMNEMPYDRGCLNANGFHGLPVLNIDDNNTRKVKGKEYQKFYNPMWSLMGDFSYPPGTYYLNKASMKSPMWYMLDQIIISKDVLPIFMKESLKIITECSYSSLSDENRRPNKVISDHFPILCEIDENNNVGGQ